ncbi:unnamed protein product [Brachionus calyciflorus]|uniref:Uncharacterized protein n=1 Tax=Brachionus calyciflorus TaxID=104777 RepID=A0A814LHY5_9BILA|nr:unnamed protein product [Brachionus calyciflorus]
MSEDVSSNVSFEASDAEDSESFSESVYKYKNHYPMNRSQSKQNDLAAKKRKEYRERDEKINKNIDKLTTGESNLLTFLQDMSFLMGHKKRTIK